MHRKAYDTRSSNNAKEKTSYVSWTVEMDRCLAKILVEQVKKGYKLDNTIKTEAYTATVASMNEKLGQKLTKEHIKHRLKTWKRQFGILVELLAQNGFEWDEERKMVIGTDSLWNDYVKAHPDARFLRAKVIENYDELCIIIGKDRAMARNLENDAELVVTDPKICKWTEEMDHTLGQILAQQVKLGYKVDNCFHPETYDIAITALKQKFGPDMTKLHIKNRLKTWRKWYKTLKELLSHSEFKWDETKKYIVASNSAWSNYVKKHPDAKVYQKRFVKNPDHLWIIFGKGQTFETCTRTGDALECSIPENEAIEAAGISGRETKQPAFTLWMDDFDLEIDLDEDDENEEDALCNLLDSSKEKGKYLKWTDEMDRCVVDMLVEQVKLGNKLKDFFNRSVYTDFLVDLSVKFPGNVLTVENIKSRLDTWNKLYGLVKEILSNAGFEWDPSRKMVVASESVWNQYIQRHSDAKFLRTRSIEMYDDLRTIMESDDQAIVNCSKRSSKTSAIPAIPINTRIDQEHAEIPDQGSSQQTRARPSSSSRGKKRSASDVLVEVMSTMAENMGRIADALTEKNGASCLEEMFEMVQKIQGFDDDLVIEACEYLSVDEKRVKMFMKLNDRLRKKWLLKRLRS